MFANFEKAFFKKNDIDTKIPKEIIQSLNEKLPEGFSYINIGNGAVGINTHASQNHVGGFKIEVPTDLPESFKPKNSEELLEFLYRTQRSIKIKPENSDTITINGATLKIDELITYPLQEGIVGKMEWIMAPEPFQPPFEVSLQGKDVSKIFKIQRQPYSDMHKRLFKNINDQAFEISYIIDEVKETVHFNFKLKIDNASNSCEVIEALKLYHAFIEGELILFNTKLPTSSNVDSEKNSIEETIHFWEKVLSLEKALQIEFIPKSAIELEDIVIIEKLYRSLIEKKPLKEYININDLTLNGTELDPEKFLVPKGLSFQFMQDSTENVLGREINLYSIICFFDFKVKEVKALNTDKSQLLLLVEPIDNKKIFQSVLYFKNSIETLEYKKTITNLSAFYDAEVIKI